MTGVVTNFVPNTLAAAANINAAFLQCYPASSVTAFSETLTLKTTAAQWRTALGVVAAPAAANDNEVAIFDTGAGAVKSSGAVWSLVAKTNVAQTWTAAQTFNADTFVPNQVVGSGDGKAANTKYVFDFFNSVYNVTVPPLASPNFTGDPKAPTPTSDDNDTSIATTAFVKATNGNYAGVKAVTTTSTLVAADYGKAIQAFAATTINITLPASNPWAGAAGPAIHIFNHGTASCSVLRQGSDFLYCPPAGLNSATSLTLQPGQDVILVNRGTTEWDVAGGTWLVANTAVVPSTAITGLGTAATKNVGTAANNVVQLNGSAQLPAIDGSLLTNIAAVWAPGTLYGLTLSRSGTATVGIAAGNCRNEDSGTAFNMTLAAATTKTTSAWAAGNGNGGLDTGTIAPNTWYHVHLIRKTSDGSIDALLSLSSTAPTMPSGYVARRRLGSVRTDGSSGIVDFIQDEDDFAWIAPVTDNSSAASSTAAQLVTMSVPPVTGIEADFEFSAVSNTFGHILVSPTNVPDLAPSTTGAPYFTVIAASGDGRGYARLRMKTGASGQIRYRNDTAASTTAYVVTYGWRDKRR
ncbi:hypothetical protein RNI52_34685 [Labrys neptuniae]|uniref:hypothetical protein n=1 Tax=Labrys neptuniae TaxID=376174 RepID=UPI00289114D7|nr:hypothetical protein [Labrys neptuniae]MDT3382525.1 hypothetical protein [Labrys neptuniae]